MSQWKWEVFLQDPGGGDHGSYFAWMMSAWGWTVAVSLTALAIALVVGSVVGVARTLPADRGVNRWFARLGNAWVEFFRNIPVLVQLFMWYFVLPQFIPVLKDFSAFWLACLALGFFTSARIAEQVRAGISAIPKGQRYAGMALGMSTVQYYRYVLLPVAYRTIIPPLTSEAMGIVKNSSVAFAVSVSELILFARQAAEETSRGNEIYMGVTVCYIITALVINRVMAQIEKKTRVPGLVAQTAGGH